jgi:arginase
MGRGPGELLQRGFADALRARGHDVDVDLIEMPLGVVGEVPSAFALARGLAADVSAARAAGVFPLVLAGNCMTSVGTVAGCGAGTGIIWFDAHGDFNTPETTQTGFVDGMALATLSGRCWRRLTEEVPGFVKVPEDTIVLVGARDLDRFEGEILQQSGVTRVPVAADAAELTAALDYVRQVTQQLYVHVDLDVLDPRELRANHFAVAGGLTVAQVTETVRAARATLPVAAAAITAFDPACDDGDRANRIALEIVTAILE